MIYNNLKNIALAGFQTAIEAANPYQAVDNILRSALSTVIQEENQNIIPIAVGKAALPMMQALLVHIPEEKRKRGGLVITNMENIRDFHQDEDHAVWEGINIKKAGHPVPDQDGYDATQELISLLKDATEQDHILICVSGGASAMLPAPLRGVSLEDKIKTTELLLQSGADITEMNIVRKHLSRIKGGGFVKIAAPAKIDACILSDVIGDDLSIIASGPTVVDPSQFKDALAIITKYQKKMALNFPVKVIEILEAGAVGNIPETMKASDMETALVQNHLIGANIESVKAVRKQLQQQGIQLLSIDYPVIGDVRQAAYDLYQNMKTAIMQKNAMENTSSQSIYALVTGGETTVQLSGNGKGGRNQEMALAFALEAEQDMEIEKDDVLHKVDWCFLSGGTDGRDGPTDAAGGIVGPETLSKIRIQNCHPQTEINNNNAYMALNAGNALIKTEATGTNVADIQIILFKFF